MYISLPSAPISERLVSIATVGMLHVVAIAALVLFAQPMIQALMAEPLHIQLVSDAQKAPEPATPEPPKVRPMASRAKPVPLPQQQQPVPVLQTQAAVPANTPVMEALPAPRDMPSPVSAQTQAISNPAPPAPVTPPRHEADYLHNPKPEYPRASRSLSEEGSVRLRVQVGEDGRPLQVLLAKSSGFARLDRAARDTVAASWRFDPARQGTKAVVGWVTFEILFELH